MIEEVLVADFDVRVGCPVEVGAHEVDGAAVGVRERHGHDRPAGDHACVAVGCTGGDEAVGDGAVLDGGVNLEHDSLDSCRVILRPVEADVATGDFACEEDDARFRGEDAHSSCWRRGCLVDGEEVQSEGVLVEVLEAFEVGCRDDGMGET